MERETVALTYSVWLLACWTEVVMHIRLDVADQSYKAFIAEYVP